MLLNEITIVITTFFSEEKLMKCLKSIDDKCKVIIIENSNNINLKNKITRNYKYAECIISKENLGYAKSNNIGLKMVKTKYGLILNPDTLLEKDTLEKFLSSANKIKDFAILGPYQQTLNETKIKNKEFKAIPVKSIKGFAMFLNINNFKNIGFFDENFFLYFEDIDLCRRATNSGYKIYKISNVVVNHEGAKSVSINNQEELEKNRNWHWMWSSFYYSKKYNGFFYSIIIFLPKFFSSLLKLIIFTVLGQKNKSKIYLSRFLGLLNSIIGKKSFYRPKI